MKASNQQQRNRVPPLCVIEVQHSADDDRDGRWFTIDRGRDPEWLVFRLADITNAYRGRPVRMRLSGSATA